MADKWDSNVKFGYFLFWIAVAVILGTTIPGGLNVAAALVWTFFVGPLFIGAMYYWTPDD